MLTCKYSRTKISEHILPASRHESLDHLWGLPSIRTNVIYTTYIPANILSCLDKWGIRNWKSTERQNKRNDSCLLPFCRSLCSLGWTHWHFREKALLLISVKKKKKEKQQGEYGLVEKKRITHHLHKCYKQHQYKRAKLCFRCYYDSCMSRKVLISIVNLLWNDFNDFMRKWNLWRL